LAGRLANALNGKLFQAVPEEIIGAIGSHDAGWAETDIPALEEAALSCPISFVSTPSAVAVQAWRRSISYAMERSPLSAYVVRSHFLLLAPRDDDREHELFRKEQEAQFSQAAIDASYDLRDLECFVAFLGFCDLLSLHLCSGWPAEFELPLAHPAHPASKDAPAITVSIQEGLLRVKGIDLPEATAVHVNGWEMTQSGVLRNCRYEWKFQ
jgi:hypothetical protein